MAYPDPPVTPPIPQRGDRATFSNRVDAFLTWVAAIIPWLQGFVADTKASLSTLAAGGANSFAYVFDASTSDSDPGPGKLRFDSATQNAATTMFLDELTSDGVSISQFLAGITSSTNPVKAAVRIQKVNNPGAWILFDVTSSTGTGYKNLALIPRASTSTSPFAAGDQLSIFFDRIGDKGQDAANAMQFLGSATVTTAVAQIDFLTAFTSTYDRYVVEIQGVCMLTDGAALLLRVARGGTLDTTASYYEGYTNTGATSSSIAGNMFSVSFGSFTIDFRDVNNTSSSSVKAIGVRGALRDASQFNAVRAAEIGFRGAAVSGFRLYASGGTITAGTVRIYGIRNV